MSKIMVRYKIQNKLKKKIIDIIESFININFI